MYIQSEIQSTSAESCLLWSKRSTPQATTAGLIVISFWLLFLFQVKSLETGLVVNMILLTHYSKPVTCHEWDHWNGFLMHHYAAFSLLLYFLFSAFFCHFSFLLFSFLLLFFLSFFVRLLIFLISLPSMFLSSKIMLLFWNQILC